MDRKKNDVGMLAFYYACTTVYSVMVVVLALSALFLKVF